MVTIIKMKYSIIAALLYLLLIAPLENMLINSIILAILALVIIYLYIFLRREEKKEKALINKNLEEWGNRKPTKEEIELQEILNRQIYLNKRLRNI